jgi:chromosomal replication initiation ATPase DnaA
MTTENRMKAFGIVEMVAEHYGVELADLLSRRRGVERVARARQVCFWLVRKRMQWITLEKVGELFGRTHGNVMRGICLIEKEYEESRAFRESVLLLWSPDVIGGLTE